MKILKFTNNQKSMNIKKWKTISKSLLVISSFAFVSCASPFYNLDSATEIIQNDKNIPQYEAIEFSENFNKEKTQLNPEDLDDELHKTMSYSPNYINTGRKWIAKFNEIMNDKNIKLDIRDSLNFLVQNDDDLSINFYSLIIDFTLTEINKKSYKDIDNFEVSFEISNNSNYEKTLFNNIVKLRPKSNSEIKIFVPRAKLVPSYILGTNVENKNPNLYFATWKIDATTYPISINVNYKNFEEEDIVEYDNIFSLNIIQGNSYALSTYFINIASSPRLADISNLAIKKFKDLTNEDFMHDINDWFIHYFKYHFFLSFKDVKNIIDFLLMENFSHKDLGNNVSMLEILMHDKIMREQIFDNQRHIKNSPIVKGILKHFDELLDLKKDKSERLSIDEMRLVLKTVYKLDFDNFIDKGIKTEIIWKEKPVVDFTDLKNPKISFAFDIKNTILQDFVIKLIDKDITDEKQKGYDLIKSLKIQKLIENVLKLDTLIKMDGIKLDNVIDKVLPSSIGVLKGEYVTLSYHAKNSPLKLNVAQTFDFSKAENITLGWTATDTAMTVDISGVNYFVDALSRKLNMVGKDKPTAPNYNQLDATQKAHAKLEYEDELIAYESIYENDKPITKFQSINVTNVVWKVTEEFKSDIFSIVHVLNEGFNGAAKTIFRSLLKKPYTVSSMPMNIGLSRAFYNMPDSYFNKPLWIEKNIGGKIHVEKSNNISLESIQNAKINETKESNEKEIINGNDNIEAAPLIGNNVKNFNFVFNDPEFKNISKYYRLWNFDEVKFYYLKNKDQKKIEERISKLNLDSDLTNVNFSKNILDLYKDNFASTWANLKVPGANSKYYEHFNPTIDPKISLVQFDLRGVLNDLLRNDIKFKDGFTNFLLDIATKHWFFGIQIFDIRKLPNSLIKLNPTLLIINPQVSTLSPSLYFVPPTLKTNTLVQDILHF